MINTYSWFAFTSGALGAGATIFLKFAFTEPVMKVIGITFWCLCNIASWYLNVLSMQQTRSSNSIALSMALASASLFHEEFGITQLIGIILTFLGAVLIGG